MHQHCSAQKILKFRSTELQRTPQCSKKLKLLTFRDLWPSSLHGLQNFQSLLSITVFGGPHATKFHIFEALQCFVALCVPNTAMLKKS